MTEIKTKYTTMLVEWEDKYVKSLKAHIEAVREAGQRLGVPEHILVDHDQTKWMSMEFPFYARQFCGDARDPDGFSVAWLHHIHHNSHHWQYWIIPDHISPRGSNAEKGAIEMLEHCALEMVADWLGSSFCYTGSWNIDNWLEKNWDKLILHSKTRKYVANVLEEIRIQRLFED